MRRSLLRGVGFALLLVATAFTAAAQAGGADYLTRRYDFGPPAASAASAAPQWIRIPRVAGRITAKELGLVINTADPYSIEVGEFYAKARGLTRAQVLRVQLPVTPTLSPDEFKAFAAQVDAFFDVPIQALALAWVQPYAVHCNSITGALALGYDRALCDHSCAASARSRYFDNGSTRPYSDLKMRPSMLLAARDVAAAKAMIQRGVAADGSLGLRGAVPVNAYFVTTGDAARNVRTPLFPPPGLLRRVGVDVHVEKTEALENASRVLIYQTGAAKVGKLDTIRWVPGALADHLTSYGGALEAANGQMSILDWIGAGATASYGTVSEPCAHPQKFPQPQVLLLNYLQGASALEAYWRSVAWPQQGVFVGEPLAAPFSRTR
ncbi:MAG TPA: TIGR03790 family protein [Burkholderiaceae bacterium]|nr:TIGR03790 family protein [Burkholderiaceae bacterium]